MTIEPGSRRILADRGDAGRRLDLVLRRHLEDVTGATRTRVQAWIESGRVSANGRTVNRVATRVKAGDRLIVVLPEFCRPQAMLPEDIALDVIHEDEHLLVINKPAGMVVHPSYRNAGRTLINALLWRARSWPGGQRPSLVGRLDKLTSGIVVVAKTAAIHVALQRALASANAEKDYLALVYGRPKIRGAVDLPLASAPHNRRRVAASRVRGVACLTRFERLARATAPRAGLSLLRCRLVTGRRHQIRAHLAASGWPLVGDPDYGEPRWRDIVDPTLAEALRTFPRQALHSRRLTFIHPFTGERLTVEAPVPDDLDRLLAITGLGEGRST